MLQKKYDKILVGKNYASLLYGVIQLESNHSVLVIDNKDVSNTSNFLTHISELDKMVFYLIGKKYGVDCLIDIQDFLTKINNVICFDKISIEFGSSAFLNINEMMRKFPTSFLELFSDFISSHSADEFDQQFQQFLGHFSLGQMNILSVAENFPMIKEVFEKYLNFLQIESEFAKQLNHVCQVMFQVCFSPVLTQEQMIYLFVTLLSPRYVINDTKIQSELAFLFRKLGGDLKIANVIDWGLEEQHLRYICLNSMDGVIELEEANLFCLLYDSLPFESAIGGNSLLSLRFKCKIDNDFIEFYKNKRLVISLKDRIGTDFPYWEFSFDDESNLIGLYAYMDNQGTKSSFYYHHAVEDLFESLIKFLPDFLKVDWTSRVSFSNGSESWLGPGHSYSEFSDKGQLAALVSKGQHKKITGLRQLGPNYSGPMGLYSYLLDLEQK